MVRWSSETRGGKKKEERKKESVDSCCWCYLNEIAGLAMSSRNLYLSSENRLKVKMYIVTRHSSIKLEGERRKSHLLRLVLCVCDEFRCLIEELDAHFSCYDSFQAPKIYEGMMTVRNLLLSKQSSISEVKLIEYPTSDR